jgi:hypothetical protein
MGGSRVPAIAVVMPVRNGEAFLDEAIASIRAQTFGDIEFIIVDDGSTDGTSRILARHAGQDPRLFLIAQPASGVVAALNRGIEAAAAPLIARMDADDVARPARLERQIAVLQAAPSLALVGSDCEIIDPAGRIRRRDYMPTSGEQIHRMLIDRNCIAHPSVLMRRDAVIGVGGYRAAFLHCEDYDLWLRLDERYELANIGEPLLAYREHGGQVTWAAAEQRILSELAARTCARHRRSGRPDPAQDVAQIRREVLERFGVGEAEIDSYVATRALDAAREAARAGNRRAALSAFSLAQRQGRLPWSTVVRFWLAWSGLIR